MADLLSCMNNNPAALSYGFATMYLDEKSPRSHSDWGCRQERVRKQIPWYRRREAKAHTGEYRWREETERWVAKQIASRTPAGLHLEERRDQVLAALGLTLEAARARLTFGPKGGAQ
jgi:hypothetical protein